VSVADDHGAAEADRLPQTAPLDWQGDIASRIITQLDSFLLEELAQSIDQRASFYTREFSSAAAYGNSLAPARTRLSHILGLRDKRVAFEELELLGTLDKPALLVTRPGHRVYRVRWPAFDDVSGEGLLLLPTEQPPAATVIAIPDADQSPEALAGLTPLSGGSPFAAVLANAGCRVIIPSLISRRMEKRRHAQLTNREWIYRPAFVLGRHTIGYELQKILALVDWAGADKNAAPVGVIGYGEGGLLALYTRALSTRASRQSVSAATSIPVKACGRSPSRAMYSGFWNALVTPNWRR
jgi:hypothetical protein